MEILIILGFLIWWLIKIVAIGVGIFFAVLYWPFTLIVIAVLWVFNVI